MRGTRWLLALVVGGTVCTMAPAQDPTSYDPTFYEHYDYFSPNNPYSPYALRLRKARLEQLKKQQGGMMARMQHFTAGVINLVNLLPPPADPNDSLPRITTGPGSPLEQLNSPSGSVADAQSPKPPKTSLFGNPTAGSPPLLGNPGGSGSSLFPRSLMTPVKQ